MRNTKPHATDFRDAQVLREAVFWTAVVKTGFDGTKVNTREDFKTLAEAKAAAERLEATHRPRRAMIYGVNAAGRSAMLTPMTEILMTAEPKVYSKKFNAQRAARAAGHADDAVMVFPAGGGFAWALKPAVRTQQAEAAARVAVKRAARAATAPRPEAAISITDPTLADHPIAQANAASWPSGPNKRKSAPTTAQREAAAKRGSTKRAAEAAAQGVIPPKPDFSAPTHARFRAKLDQVAAMVEAGDIAGLRAFEIKPISSSPKAIDRYRTMAVIALEARAAGAGPSA